MANILEINNLSASYEDGQVLNDVSISLKEGEILCIVGESGSGKSSLIRAITGFQNLEIDSGQIEFMNENILALSAKKRRQLMGRHIGLIPQNPAGSFNPIRSFSHQFKEMLKSANKEFNMEQIREAFAAVGLSDADSILKSMPFEMSGGMNQRIAIAAAILLSPELIICDEATSALDVTTAAMVMEELLQLRTKRESSLLIVTHNLGLAKNMADRIVIMYKGQLVEEGRAENIITNPQHEYTRKLLQCAPRIKK